MVCLLESGGDGAGKPATIACETSQLSTCFNPIFCNPFSTNDLFGVKEYYTKKILSFALMSIFNTAIRKMSNFLSAPGLTFSGYFLSELKSPVFSLSGILGIFPYFVLSILPTLPSTIIYPTLNRLFYEITTYAPACSLARPSVAFFHLLFTKIELLRYVSVEA